MTGNTSRPLGIECNCFNFMLYPGERNAMLIHHSPRGSFVLSRLANYYSSRLTKYVFLDVGYNAPGHGLSTETLRFIDSSIKTALGFSVFGYFLFFNDQDAPALMDKNVSLCSTSPHLV